MGVYSAYFCFALLYPSLACEGIGRKDVSSFPTPNTNYSTGNRRTQRGGASLLRGSQQASPDRSQSIKRCKSRMGMGDSLPFGEWDRFGASACKAACALACPADAPRVANASLRLKLTRNASRLFGAALRAQAGCDAFGGRFDALNVATAKLSGTATLTRGSNQRPPLGFWMNSRDLMVLVV